MEANNLKFSCLEEFYTDFLGVHFAFFFFPEKTAGPFAR